MMTAAHAPPPWRRLGPARLQPDDNPASVRVRKYLTGTHLLLAAAPAEVAPVPRELIWQRGPVRLWRYTSAGRSHRVPVILVYAMILRPYILDLVRGRSVVEFLVDAGHDVWLVDWGDPRPADSRTGLDSYIDTYLRAVVTTVAGVTGCAAATLIGHCQGGTLAAIYAAMHPGEVRNLVLLAAPIDFVPVPPHAVGSWSLWSRQRWYDPRVLLGAGGNVPADLPGRAVATLSAPATIAAPWLAPLRTRLVGSEDGRAWLGACQWVDDSPPLSGTAWVQWLAGCYQRNDLVRGRMRIGGRRVELGRVTADVLRIRGRRDVVTPPHQTARPAHLPAARGFATVEAPAGHVGLIVGPAARTTMYQPLGRWLATRSG
jgi:polyhydroxyalkanoate synthase